MPHSFKLGIALENVRLTAPDALGTMLLHGPFCRDDFERSESRLMQNFWKVPRFATSPQLSTTSICTPRGHSRNRPSCPQLEMRAGKAIMYSSLP